MQKEGLDSCKKQRVLMFCYQLLAFKEVFQNRENAFRWANDIRTNTCSRYVGSICYALKSVLMCMLCLYFQEVL